MKYIKQFGIILAVTCLGELLRMLIPFPIPATIYGLALMLGFLKFKVIKLEEVQAVGEFLIGIMPILFVPATVGLMATWTQLEAIVLPVLAISIVSTFVVMIVSGKVTDIMLSKKEDDDGTNIF